jgi:uncharacterized membrane protein SpoIIM required for sporulation
MLRDISERSKTMSDNVKNSLTYTGFVIAGVIIGTTIGHITGGNSKKVKRKRNRALRNAKCNMMYQLLDIVDMKNLDKMQNIVSEEMDNLMEEV